MDFPAVGQRLPCGLACAWMGRSRHRAMSGHSTSRSRPSRARVNAVEARPGRGPRSRGALRGIRSRGGGPASGGVRGRPCTASGNCRLKGSLSVVGGAPPRVPEHLPRGVDRLHPPARLGPRRRVRVVLAGEASIRGGDHLVLRLRVDLEDLVRIRASHADALSVVAGPSTVGTPGCDSSPRVAMESASAVESPGLARRNR